MDLYLDMLLGVIMGLIFLLLVIIVLFSFPLLFIFIVCDEKEENIKTAIKDGYKVYINGKEVSAENIDVFKYSDVTINDELQRIIITVD